MRKEIQTLFTKRKELNIEEIKDSLCCQKASKNETNKILAGLKKLERNGILYYDEKNKTYSALPSNFFVTEIYEIQNGYIYFKINNEKHKINCKNDLNIHDLIIVKKDKKNFTIIKKLEKQSLKEDIYDVEKLTKLFYPENNYTFKELKKKLKISNQELHSLLEELKKENKIIYDFDNDTYIPIKNNYFITTCKCNKKGTMSIEYKKETFILSDKETYGILPFDKVLFQKTDFGFKLIKIIKRNNPEIVCEIMENGKIKMVGNSNILIKDNHEIKKLNLPVGTRILVNLDNELNSNGFKITLKEILGHKNDLNSDLEAIAYNNGFSLRYSEEQIKQAYSLPTFVSDKEKEGRYDLTHKKIFTIDSKHTKDMDDAVGIEVLENGNYLLTVAIADVAHYIKPNSPLYERAKENTTSLYLIDSVLHMLHPQLSNGICSLNPDEERLAKAYEIEISPNGDVKDFQIKNAVIKSKKKMTYEDVNKILEENLHLEDYEDYRNELLLMNELSHILTNKRKNNGALDFDSKEIVFKLDENKNIKDITTQTQQEAEKIIENFMVLTNEQVAEYMLNLGMTFVYRNHDIPFDDKVNETVKLIKTLGYRVNTINNCSDPHVLQKILQTLSSKEEFFILSSLLLRSMQRAYFSTDNHGHFGLASEAYSQTTSPIRRLMDLIIEYIIDNIENIFKDEENFKILEKELKELCERATFMEKCADKAEYEANKLYMIEYCLKNQDQEYYGFIQEITPNYIVVKTNELIEGIVLIDDIEYGQYKFNPNNKCLENNNKNKLYIGSKLNLKLKEANKEFRVLYFNATPLINELKLTKKINH